MFSAVIWLLGSLFHTPNLLPPSLCCSPASSQLLGLSVCVSLSSGEQHLLPGLSPWALLPPEGAQRKHFSIYVSEVFTFQKYLHELQVPQGRPGCAEGQLLHRAETTNKQLKHGRRRAWVWDLLKEVRRGELVGEGFWGKSSLVFCAQNPQQVLESRQSVESLAWACPTLCITPGLGHSWCSGHLLKRNSFCAVEDISAGTTFTEHTGMMQGGSASFSTI